MSQEHQPAAADSQLQFTPEYLIFDDLPGSALIQGRTVEQLLKTSSSTRWRLEKSGQLVGVKIGSSKRYRVSAVRALMDRAEVTA